MNRYSKGLGSGWHQDSYRHTLARYGIKTKSSVDYNKPNFFERQRMGIAEARRKHPLMSDMTEAGLITAGIFAVPTTLIGIPFMIEVPSRFNFPVKEEWILGKQDKVVRVEQIKVSNPKMPVYKLTIKRPDGKIGTLHYGEA
jgi:hypothetical protein